MHARYTGTLFDAVWDEDDMHFSVPPECNLRYTRQLVPFAVYIDGSMTNEHWRVVKTTQVSV